jgi:hypothetical protein
VISKSRSKSVSLGVTTSKYSTSTNMQFFTVTATKTSRKPSAWEVYRRKQEAAETGR